MEKVEDETTLTLASYFISIIMNLNLNEKIIVVTGNAEGIGEGIVKVLAEENAIPVIVGRKETDNLKTLESVGIKGFQVTAELTKPTECENAVRKIVEKFGRIDGLINNAGVSDEVGLEKGNYEQFVALLHKNLINYYLITHHVLPYLKQFKGVIVNIGAKTAASYENASEYATSNGGSNALTREWAVELLPYSIRVNSVIVTEYHKSSHNSIMDFNNPEEKLKSLNEKTLLGKRLTTTEEIANVVAFLLSERSSHTTGQLIQMAGTYVHYGRDVS